MPKADCWVLSIILCSRCWRPQLPYTIRTCLGWSCSQGAFWRAMGIPDHFSAPLSLTNSSGCETVTATGLRTVGMGKACPGLVSDPLWPGPQALGLVLHSPPRPQFQPRWVSRVRICLCQLPRLAGSHKQLWTRDSWHGIPECGVLGLSLTMTAPPPLPCPDCSLRKRLQRSGTLPSGTF